jgi:hypothetical protein
MEKYTVYGIFILCFDLKPDLKSIKTSVSYTSHRVLKNVIKFYLLNLRGREKRRKEPISEQQYKKIVEF